MKHPRYLLHPGYAILLAISSPAWSHAQPQRQSPPAGQTIPAPKQVRIDFSEPLEPAFSQIQLLGPKGNSISSAKTQVDGNHMTLALSPLAKGSYQVKWRVMARDGHRTQGHYSFQVQ